MIKVEKLKKTYDRGRRNAHEVLHGMSFELADTGFVCILGASGCGKTSLLNAIGGLDSFDSGKIITDNAEIVRSGSRAMENERNAEFGYIFQNYYLLGEHSAAYNVYLGMHSLDIPHEEKLRRVKDALTRVDMLRYIKKPVSELSGGQQQRVAIARAIARQPRVIFADEPTGNLDEANTMNICSILKELSQTGLVVMVTHETRIAKLFADRIITVEDGNIVSDVTDWERSDVDIGEKDAIYTADYAQESIAQDTVSMRVLTADGAAPVSLVLAVEKDRIIIKVDDPRVVLCSETQSAPRLIEGERPKLSQKTEESVAASRNAPPRMRAGKGGFGLSMLLREAFTLSTQKKIKKFGIGIFIVLLSLTLVITVSDIITVSNLDPREFATTDPHILELELSAKNVDMLGHSQADLYRELFVQHLEKSGLDFDIIPKISTSLSYTNDIFYQLGSVRAVFYGATYADVSRLSEKQLVSGRMPERFDEIVIDEWLVEKLSENATALGTAINNPEFFIGKQLYMSSVFKPTVVGICNSGGPTVYMTKSALLSSADVSKEILPFSEYVALTGYDKLTSLSGKECIIISQNANQYFTDEELASSPYVISLPTMQSLIVRDCTGYDDTFAVGVCYVVSDEYFEALYRDITTYKAISTVWCADKAAMLEYLKNDFPAEITNELKISISDSYGVAYEEYFEGSMKKIEARMIVTVAVIVVSAVMLYLMQRSKTRERMDIISVYRLLGVPKGNLCFMFAVENLLETLKYSLPTVAVGWLAVDIISRTELSLGMIYPLWAAALTFGVIAVFRLAVTLLPLLRLLSYSPASLAAKYDL